jgi:hypothetical protein
VPLWILLLGGTAIGAKWGPDLIEWVKGKVAPAASKAARPAYCDPSMPPEACADVANLVSTVRDPAILAAAAAEYEAQGYHRAAAALASRAAAVVKAT